MASERLWIAVAGPMVMLTTVTQADFIWDGSGGNDLWTTGSNWVGNIAPGFDVSDNLVFGPTGANQSPDAGDGEYFNIAALAFTGADSKLTLTGTGSLSFDDGASITNDSTFAQRINIAIIGNGNSLVIDAMAGELTFGRRINLSDTDGVELTVTGAEDVTFNGRVAGEGGKIIKSGAGRLTLNAANTFDGGVELQDGVILVGDNAALGTGDLEVTGDGELRSDDDLRTLDNVVRITSGNTLTIRGSRDLTLTGKVRGSGALTLNTNNDNMLLTLSGDNSYSGGTTLNRGGIILGSDTALGTGMLTLTGDGGLQSNDDEREITNDIDLGTNRLTVAGGNSLTLGGIISGTGQLFVKLEDSALILTLDGANTFSGLTRIQEGELRLKGSVGGDMQLDAGATLSGDGRVSGDLIARDRSTVSPGPGVDTVTVGGNYDQQAGSTYVVDLDSDTGTADQIDSRGSATLADDSTISVSIDGTGFLANGQTFDIIQADLGVTDNGADIVVESATLTVDIVREDGFMNGDSIYALEVLRSDSAYSDAARPGNNSNLGGALDSLIPIAEADPTGDVGSLLGTLDALDADTYDTALQELTPQPYLANERVAFDTAQMFALDQSSYLAAKRNSVEAWSRFQHHRGPAPGSLASLEVDTTLLTAALNEMQDAAPEAMGGMIPADKGSYFNIIAARNQQDVERDRTGFDADTFGFAGGLDKQFSETMTLGMAIGYAHTESDYEQGVGGADIDTIRFGPYLTLDLDGWYLDASVTGAYTKFDSTRRIPTTDASHGGDYDGFDISGYVAAGFPRRFSNNLFVTPIVSLQYTHLSADGFTEDGPAASSLVVDDTDGDSFRTSVGVTISGLIDLGTKLVPSLHLGWRHEFIDDNTVDARFAAGGAPFSTGEGSVDSDGIVIGLSLDALLETSWFAFVRAETVITGDGDLTWITGGLSWRF